MSSNPYIGRGEVLTKKILLKLLNCVEIQGQVNIQKVVKSEDYDILDIEIKQHNFDFVMRRNHAKDVIIEVNYKHKEKAAKKWRQIFVPMIEKTGYDYLVIHDWNCRERGLFWLNSKKEHPVTWDDFKDVIDALKTAGIAPDISLE